MPLFYSFTSNINSNSIFTIVSLSSASGDGRVLIWKISEDLNGEDKPHIAGKLILAIQMVGDRELFHPRVCWHTHKQVRMRDLPLVEIILYVFLLGHLFYFHSSRILKSLV